MKYEYSFIKNLNWFIIGIVSIISFMGIANLYSLQYTSGENIYLSQMMWFVLGSVLFTAIVFIDYRIFSAIAVPMYVINVILLFLVLIIGKEVNFSKRWLDFGFFMFQPSETMKLTLLRIAGGVNSSWHTWFLPLTASTLKFKLFDIVKSENPGIFSGLCTPKAI